MITCLNCTFRSFEAVAKKKGFFHCKLKVKYSPPDDLWYYMEHQLATKCLLDINFEDNYVFFSAELDTM